MQTNQEQVTLTEALTLLRNSLAPLKADVIEGKYALWIGSGVSKSRLPDVKNLLRNLFICLHQNTDSSNPNCPYRKTIEGLIGMTTRLGKIDPLSNPEDWPKDIGNDLLDQLLRRYPDVLDQEVRLNGGVKDIAWDILELPKIYSDPTVQPDAEHRFIALLIEEGIFSVLVTTNWDSLTEEAHKKCRPNEESNLKVVACNKDLSAAGSGAARLFKIHGCARRTIENPEQYRPFFVATRTQINEWSSHDRHRPLREAINVLLRSYPALFVGLSGQDYNLQGSCVSASLHEAYLPINPPRVAFTEAQITPDQHAILKAIYGSEAYQNNAGNIDAKAAIPLYAKPLLGSLYIITLFEKANLLLELGAEELKKEHRVLIKNSMETIETSLCKRYDEVKDPKKRWRKLALEVPYFISHFIKLYRRQQPLAGTEEYQPLIEVDSERMRGDLNLPMLGFHWLLLSLALLVCGMERGLWKLEAPDINETNSGQVIVNQKGNRNRLFILKSSDGLARLDRLGFINITNAPGVIVLYPHEKKPVQLTRSPHRSLPGKHFSNVPKELWFQDAIAAGLTTDQLISLIETEFSAARAA